MRQMKCVDRYCDGEVYFEINSFFTRDRSGFEYRWRGECNECNREYIFEASTSEVKEWEENKKKAESPERRVVHDQFPCPIFNCDGQMEFLDVKFLSDEFDNRDRLLRFSCETCNCDMLFDTYRLDMKAKG